MQAVLVGRVASAWESRRELARESNRIRPPSRPGAVTPFTRTAESSDRMVTGVNTNFRHRGVLFHVQSEASGIKTPHILTHLFKGGDILASVRGDYSANIGSENLEAEVRAMMEEQHKSMLRALSRGDHDEAIISRLGPDIFPEKGTDTDVTIPPPELIPTVEATPEPIGDQPGGDPAFPEPTDAQYQPVDGAEAAPHANEANPASARDQLSRAFGDGVVSQKPLDEVVLDFLVDNARKRKRSGK